MSRHKIFMTLSVLFIFFAAWPVLAQDQATQDVIRSTLSEGKKVEGHELYAAPLLQSIYEAREFKPIWIKGDGLSSMGKELMNAIDSVKEEGLSPALYNKDKIEESLKKSDTLSDAELLMSEAFASIAYHYAYGAVDTQSGKIRRFEPAGQEKLKVAFNTAINTSNVEGPLKSLLPTNNFYIGLKKALVSYEGMAGKVKWPKIASLAKGQKIKAGDSDERIPHIRERLGLKAKAGENINDNIYDAELEAAVIGFQQELGLLDDGVIGYRTVDAMNVTVEDRICQIRTNMDRIRALSNIFEEPRRVVVNIPAFWLETYEDGKLALDMKVITGMVKRKTPTLSSEIVHLIFSPRWYVPDTILFEDKLPKIRKDPSYLKRHGMRVYEKGGGEVDPESVDWTQFQSKRIPYRVVQGSGDANALGRVKFIFPNRYDVYLHDTPDKHLFKNAQRSFSSGCMRIEKPVELARLLLKDKPEWTEDKIRDAMNRSYEQVVPLTKPMPIHVIYVTAWVDKNGNIAFRDDIYGRDGPYKKLLCD